MTPPQRQRRFPQYGPPPQPAAPARKEGEERIATSWSRLVVGPWMRADRSAATSRRAAAARVSPHAITFASIAS